jgi:hypothetical protein
MPGTLTWQRPAQYTNAQLTDAVGTHRTGGHDPIGRLLAEGIVLICTEFPPRRLGYRLMSYLWLRVDPARLDHVGTALAGHTPISFAAAVTGRTTWSPPPSPATALVRPVSVATLHRIHVATVRVAARMPARRKGLWLRMAAGKQPRYA